MAAFATLISAISICWIFTWLLLIITLLVTHFFRDPERITTVEEHDIISPADGKVIAVEKTIEPCFTQKSCWKISIFMSVFDVHVNRIPYSGVLKGLRYKKGHFWAAQKPRASQENEQNWLWLHADSGQHIVLTQVAGLIARRIVCWPNVGDRMIRGERFGMIRFGSRLDVYVPEGSEILISKGDYVFAGESALCRMN
jgi:phosphatidylserine decarboxylase